MMKKELLEEVRRKIEEVEKEIDKWNITKGELKGIEKALEGNPKEDELNIISLSFKEKKLDTSSSLHEKLLYLQADFDNYRKRKEKEEKELLKFASVPLIEKFIEVIDTLEIALDSSRHSRDKGKIEEGIRMVLEQMRSILSEEGVKEIKACGEKFDPNFHEAVEEVSCNPEGIIVEEIKKGYILKDRVIRPSLVKVAKGEEKGKGEEGKCRKK
jgi:molecular chaperone GrpE